MNPLDELFSIFFGLPNQGPVDEKPKAAPAPQKPAAVTPPPLPKAATAPAPKAPAAPQSPKSIAEEIMRLVTASQNSSRAPAACTPAPVAPAAAPKAPANPESLYHIKVSRRTLVEICGLIIQSPMNNRNEFMNQFIEVAASIDPAIVAEGIQVALRYATGTR